jgi:hypothetical protein
MNGTSRLRLPTTLSFVVIAAATFATSSEGCDSSSSSSEDVTICVVADDAGAHQKCPDEPAPGKDCPAGCQTEVV